MFCNVHTNLIVGVFLLDTRDHESLADHVAYLMCSSCVPCPPS